MRRAFCIGVLFLAVAASAFAQTGTEGAILGVVVDQSQAVVPGAEVVVQNEETGIKRTVNTNEAGIFEVIPLPNGRYTVSVSAQGFKAWQQTGVLLRVGERMRLSPTLEVGQRTEKITVAATVQLLQTDSVQTGGTVEANQIRDLPLNSRNAAALVETVPGMIYEGQAGGPERGQYVFGGGLRDDQTNFQVDGHSANGSIDEGGAGIPSIDTIAEFSVLTSSFTAETGAYPMQILMATKTGTNAFHGSLFEFLRNDALDARNTFALSNPKLIRNQYGGTIGGPIRKNKTFFFFSAEFTKVRQDALFNSTVVQPAMLDGFFANEITDPLTGEPFPQVASDATSHANMYQIPTERFSGASKFFFDGVSTPNKILLPNNADGRFHALAGSSDDKQMYSGRVDHQITEKQRISGRWNFDYEPLTAPAYRPDLPDTQIWNHHNTALNYTYNINASTLLTLGVAYMNAFWHYHTPDTGNVNLTDQAGIQGFPTSQVGKWIGMPSVGFAGYTGFADPWGRPGRNWSEQKDARANVILSRGKHTINLGAEFAKRGCYGEHGSFAPRGSFSFNGQYTGDGFADYLLGYLSSAGRNRPLHIIGEKRIPYTGLYFQDTFNISSKLTLNYGVRWDEWYEKSLERGDGGYFDITLGKMVAGVNDQGVLDMTNQPVTPYLAAATEGMWVTAVEAGKPHGLYYANGYISPRIGVAWRPTAKGDLVIRGGYGIYPSTFVNNISASSAASLPYWSYETPAWNASTLQRWETAFPAVPNTFTLPSGYGPLPTVKAQRNNEWNISVQKGMPLHSALTVSYVGNHVYGAVSGFDYDEVNPAYLEAHPGADIQSSRPFPQYGSLVSFNNIGDTWYNAMHMKWERRFTQGLSFNVSYAYGSTMIDNVSSSVWGNVDTFAPSGYNRTTSGFGRTHILTANWIWELPVGHGRKYMSSANRAADLVLGGWELTGLYRFTSGSPLTMYSKGDPLQNGWGTRADQIGDPSISNPSANGWFNTAAFATSAAYTYGNSKPGVVQGPGFHGFDMGLLKNFRITESARIQFRLEMYNAVNHVNYGDPGTSVGYDSFGKIYDAGDARQIQFGLKFIF